MKYMLKIEPRNLHNYIGRTIKIQPFKDGVVPYEFLIDRNGKHGIEFCHHYKGKHFHTFPIIEELDNCCNIFLSENELVCQK